jgi:hypothetical protein
MAGFPSLINNIIRGVGRLPPVKDFAYVMSQKSTKKINIIIQNKNNI